MLDLVLRLHDLVSLGLHDTQAANVYLGQLRLDEGPKQNGNLIRAEPEQTYEQGITLTRSNDYGWRICESLAVIDP